MKFRLTGPAPAQIPKFPQFQNFQKLLVLPKKGAATAAAVAAVLNCPNKSYSATRYVGMERGLAKLI